MKNANIIVGLRLSGVEKQPQDPRISPLSRYNWKHLSGEQMKVTKADHRYDHTLGEKLKKYEIFWTYGALTSNHSPRKCNPCSPILAQNNSRPHDNILVVQIQKNVSWQAGGLWLPWTDPKCQQTSFFTWLRQETWKTTVNYQEISFSAFTFEAVPSRHKQVLLYKLFTLS